MESPIIEVKNLSKHYRLGSIGAGSLREELSTRWEQLRGGKNANSQQSFRALDDISFTVSPGEILGVIGRNGAGKSTLLKILSRITEPTAGEGILRGRVASLLEVGTGFHPELSGRENIFLSGAVLGMSKAEIREKFDDIVAFAEIEKFIDSPIKRYSSGMAVRLGFAVAAHLNSDILIVDEVLAVGDVNFQEKCLEKMSAIRASGRTILFVSHNPISIEMLCHRCILLEQGKLIFSGQPRAVLDRYEAECHAQKQRTPGDEKVSDSSMKVSLLQDGAPTDRPRIDHPFQIRLGFQLPQGWPDIYPNFQLRTRSQTVVFSTVSPVVCPSNNEERHYVAECEIPANFLNAANYSIATYLLSPNGLEMESIEHALDFSTTEDPCNRPMNFTGNWIGATRPTLPWKVITHDS